MIQSILKEIDAHMGLWFIPQSNLVFNDNNDIVEIASITDFKIIGVIDKNDISGENITIAFSHYGLDSENLFIHLIKEFFFNEFGIEEIVIKEGEENINRSLYIQEEDESKLSLILKFYGIDKSQLSSLVNNEERTYFEYVKDKNLLSAILNIDREDINILREVTTNRVLVIEQVIADFLKVNSGNVNYLTNLKSIANESDWYSELISLLVRQINWRN
jgi:hypothetical protein